MSTNTTTTARKRRKLLPMLLATGIAASLLLAFANTNALSGFTANINNTNNTIGAGTLLMSETQDATTCLSSAAGTVTASNAGTCSTINKFGGSNAVYPGGPLSVSTVTIRNAGTTTANTFNLTPSGCVQVNNGSVNGTATDFCKKVNITIDDVTGGNCVFPAAATPCAATPTTAGTLDLLKTDPIGLRVPMAPGDARVFKFTLQLDNSATNAYQGLAANEALLWSFAS
jgi:hypothetical protein